MTDSPLDPTAMAASPGDADGRRSRAAGNAPGGPALRDDIDMRIGRDGTWFYHGSPIARKPLVRLFASVLSRDEDGRFWLTTPVEKVPVAVDDAPFVAVALEVSGHGRDRALTFRTNLDETVTADADHPIRVAVDAATGEPSPYVLVRDRLEALIARAVFYELAELAVEETVDGGAALGVWSKGCFFPLAPPATRA